MMIKGSLLWGSPIVQRFRAKIGILGSLGGGILTSYQINPQRKNVMWRKIVHPRKHAVSRGGQEIL